MIFDCISVRWAELYPVFPPEEEGAEQSLEQSSRVQHGFTANSCQQPI